MNQPSPKPAPKPAAQQPKPERCDDVLTVGMQQHRCELNAGKTHPEVHAGGGYLWK